MKRFGAASVSVDGLPPIDLPELIRVADLGDRFDVKQLGTVADVPRVVEALGPRFRVLDIDGRRITHVTTIYYDTPDATLLRAHAQGRRRRFKVRLRHYGDPVGAVLEVKAKGNRGETRKRRMPYSLVGDGHLDARGEAYIAEQVHDLYELQAPSQLHPRAVTRFQRLALVSDDTGERVTIDGAIQAEVDGSAVSLDPDRVVVEVKGPTPAPRFGRVLWSLRLRPVPVSKYCLVMAMAHPDLPGNEWLPAARWFRAETARPAA